jgi:hypothetical protein
MKSLMTKGFNKTQIADRLKVDVKTIRAYQQGDLPPSAIKKDHDWVTRTNPYDEVWPEVEELLLVQPELQAVTIFDHLQRTYPGQFQNGQKRSLERRIRKWKALNCNKEVYFDQTHRPGELGASDFSHMTECDVTIANCPFPHMIYHFVLTYSNWESVMVCESETFDNLADGLQKAMWELSGAPTSHRTDRLSAAVKNLKGPSSDFTDSYKGLMNHYGMDFEKIQAGKGHENGDVEQSHYRFKTCVKQALMLRGSRNFENIDEYNRFLQDLVIQRNKGKSKRFEEDLKHLHPLPESRLNTDKIFTPKVTKNSTISINSNIYSVHSGLIGERLKVRQKSDSLEIWLGTDLVDLVPRIRGSNRHSIHYRHIIDSLIKKPGAFHNYVFREELFPSTNFRLAYDQLCEKTPSRATKEYLKILYLAAKESEAEVQNALTLLLKDGQDINENSILEVLTLPASDQDFLDAQVDSVDLNIYDELVTGAAS